MKVSSKGIKFAKNLQRLPEVLFQSDIPLVGKSPMQCAGINRHEAGNERVPRERSSEPLAPSFALHTARCVAKRKQGYRWAGY